MWLEKIGIRKLIGGGDHMWGNKRHVVWCDCWCYIFIYGCYSNWLDLLQLTWQYTSYEFWLFCYTKTWFKVSLIINLSRHKRPWERNKRVDPVFLVFSVVIRFHRVSIDITNRSHTEVTSVNKGRHVRYVYHIRVQDFKSK